MAKPCPICSVYECRNDECLLEIEHRAFVKARKEVDRLHKVKNDLVRGNQSLETINRGLHRANDRLRELAIAWETACYDYRSQLPNPGAIPSYSKAVDLGKAVGCHR